MEKEGIKHDKGKTRWSLLPFEIIEEIVKVMEFGADTYGIDNWKQLKNFNDRFFSACIRHLVKWKQGNKIDDETNLSHLAHAATCIIFLLWKQSQVSEEKILDTFQTIPKEMIFQEDDGEY